MQNKSNQMCLHVFSFAILPGLLLVQAENSNLSPGGVGPSLKKKKLPTWLQLFTRGYFPLKANVGMQPILN